MTASRTSKTRFLDRADRILTRTATAVAAATGAGMVAQPQHAQAGIIYSGVVNINVPSTTAGVYLSLSTGVANTSPAAVPGWDINPWSASTFNRRAAI
jgi:uncharacterized protein YcnI